MNRTTKWIIIGVALLVVIFLVFPYVGRLLMGTGSRRYAREWTQRLAPCRTLADITNQFDCLDVTGKDGVGWDHVGNRLTLLTFTNGDWIVLRSANSHGDVFGGTVVTHDSTGATRVFFGHVCGSETLRGVTLEQAYSNVIANFDRKEVILDGK